MGIQHVNPRTCTSNIRIARISKEILVRMIGSPEDRLFLALHWLGERSYPCLGTECKVHTAPRQEYGYFPAAYIFASKDGQQGWQPIIVPFTSNIAELAYIETPTHMLAMKRMKGVAKSLLEYRVTEKFCDEPNVHFDLRAALCKIWKLPPSVFDSEE